MAARAMAMLDQPELLQDVEGAIYGRGGRGLVALATTGDQHGRGDVALMFAQYIHQRAALRRPAKAGRTQPSSDSVPGRRLPTYRGGWNGGCR